jgi:hypothetical protein
MHYYHEKYYEELYKKPKKFVYETYLGPANLVLMIQDLKYKKDLMSFYNYAELNNKYTSFNFPLKGLPQNEPVYVLGYTEDSLLLEVVSLYDRGAHFGGSFTQGYVYYKTVHDVPPPDSLMPKPRIK